MKCLKPLLIVGLLLLLPFSVKAKTAEVESRSPHHLGALYELSVGFGEVSWRWSVPGELQQFDIDDPTAFEMPDTLCAVTCL